MSNNIKDLIIYPLNQIIDDRGAVLKFLDSSSPSFSAFGEAYYSKINSGVIKGWKYHKRIYQNFCVPFGRVKMVVYDDREKSKYRGFIDEIILDDSQNYCLLSMPPLLWYSFKSESENFSILSNIASEKHDKNESINAELINSEIPYEWK